MKKCRVCKSDMKLIIKTVETNTTGTVAASGAAYVLLSSSSPQTPFGTPIEQRYWLCTNESCRAITEDE